MYKFFEILSSRSCRRIAGIFIIYIFSLGLANGQSESQGEVYLSNDYRQNESPTVIVKWFAQKVYYPQGFNVYRQDSGQMVWTKLNEQPVNFRDEVPQQLAVQDEELRPFLNVVKETPYEGLPKGIKKPKTHHYYKL